MIYFHLGTPKTGTSALQHALAALRDELPNYGVLYPREWCANGIAHHELPKELIAAPAGSFDPFMGYLSKRRDSNIFISSEQFTNMLGPERVQQLIGFINACNAITVARGIIALRRTDLYVESAYLQRVRFREIGRSIEEHAARHRSWGTKFFTGLRQLKRMLL